MSTINKKGLLKYGIALIIFPICVNVLGLIKIPRWMLSGKTSDWINFYGGYVGAILGAFIALTIVQYEIKENRKIEEEKLKKRQIPDLVSLEIEFEKAINYLNLLKGFLENRIPGMNIESIEQPQSMKYDINNFNKVDNTINYDLLRQVIRFKEMYIMKVKIMELNINEIREKSSNNINEVSKYEIAIQDKKDVMKLETLSELIIEAKVIKDTIENELKNT